MKLWFLGIFIFISVFSLAQSDKVLLEWGNKNTNNFNYNVQGIIGQDETGFYIYKSTGGIAYSNPIIAKYSAFNSLEKSMFWSGTQGEDKLQRSRVVESFGMTNNDLFVVSSSVTRKDKTKSIFIETIDREQFVQRNDVKLIGSFNFHEKYKWRPTTTKVKVAQNKKQIAVISEVAVSDLSRNYELYINLLSEDLSSKWNTIVSFEHASRNVDVEDFFVANNGDVYILFFLKNFGSKKGVFKLIRLSSGEQTEVNVPFEGRKMIASSKIEQAADGNIYIYGLYMNMTVEPYIADDYFIDGIFIAPIDEDGKISDVKEIRIPKEYVLDQLSDSKKERELKKYENEVRSKELSNFKVKDFIVEGEFSYLFCEQDYIYENANNGHSKNFNDIMVVKFDNENEIVWAKKIRKKQVHNYDEGYFSSFSAKVLNGNVYVLFNDNKKNFTGKGKMIHNGGITHSNSGKNRLGRGNNMGMPGMPGRGFPGGFGRPPVPGGGNLPNPPGGGFPGSPGNINPHTANRKNFVLALVMLTQEGDFSKEILYHAYSDGISIVPRACDNENEKWIIYSRGMLDDSFGTVILD